LSLSGHNPLRRIRAETQISKSNLLPRVTARTTILLPAIEGLRLVEMQNRLGIVMVSATPLTIRLAAERDWPQDEAA
jgi:hypothetical protein